MPRFGRSSSTIRPTRIRRGQAIALTLLLLITGSPQQSLAEYARDLVNARRTAGKAYYDGQT